MKMMKATGAINSNRARASGQAQVEFALTIVFVFFVFVAIIELIMLVYAYNAIADSAKEGVRYAITHGTGTTNCSGPNNTSVTPNVPCDTAANKVKAAVTDYAVWSLHGVAATDITVNYNPNGDNGANCNKPGCAVRVEVHYVYQPFFGLGWPTLTVHAASQGRIMF
jgi:Flp pilus assembly protein TadG